jgi:hypothetical protein
MKAGASDISAAVLEVLFRLSDFQELASVAREATLSCMKLLFHALASRTCCIYVQNVTGLRENHVDLSITQFEKCLHVQGSVRLHHNVLRRSRML